MIKRAPTALAVFRELQALHLERITQEMPNQYKAKIMRRYKILTHQMEKYLEGKWFFTNRQFNHLWSMNYTIWADGSMSKTAIKCHNTASQYVCTLLRELREKLK